MGGNALSHPGKAQPLLCGSLDAHPIRVNAHSPRQIVPHDWNMRRQLRPLGYNCGVHIAHSIFHLAQNVYHVSECVPAGLRALCKAVSE